MDDRRDFSHYVRGPVEGLLTLDLILAEVGSGVDIGCADERDEFVQFEVAVAKHHAVSDAELRRERDERRDALKQLSLSGLDFP